MTRAELTSQIMALPPAERAAIAQMVWQSIEDERVAISPQSDAEALASARARDEEMSRGDVTERPHEEVMKGARRAVECE